MRKRLTLLSSMLFCLSFAGITTSLGCSKDNTSDNMPPICGGRTDNTNVDAPKTIISKDITAFSTRFFAYDKYSTDTKTGLYCIKITTEDDSHLLKITGPYNYSATVDDKVIEDIQEIIDKYNLVSKNGISSVTAGLPAEYGPWSLSVTYASGENLFFYEDGMPDAGWTTAFRDYFIDLMVADGFEDAFPPKGSDIIKNFSFMLNIDGEYHSYEILERAGKEYLWHMNLHKNEMIEYVEVSDELFDMLQKTITSNHMEILNTNKPFSSTVEPGSEFLSICIIYSNGDQIFGEFVSSELPPEWPQMKNALLDTFDKYILMKTPIVY